jgi:hypothetical protein
MYTKVPLSTDRVDLFWEYLLWVVEQVTYQINRAGGRLSTAEWSVHQLIDYNITYLLVEYEDVDE